MPHTRIMMHQPATGVRGQASDIDIEAREIINFRERVNQLIAEAILEELKRDAYVSKYLRRSAAD